MVNIKGMDKARVLKALYDSSHIQGTGYLQAVPEGVVTVELCSRLLDKNTYFDYLYGRVLKVDLSGDEFDERLYDRDCGEGAAQRAVDSVRAEREQDGSEKKKPSLEEKTQRTKEAIKKIADIMAELPPDERYAATVLLKMMLMGPGTLDVAGMLMRGGPLTPPPFPFKGRFG